ncbi:hypothetical protein CTheo_562 [Ceratobasidium theobromae]|uniref:Polysaccharide lyase 14 domain-containing protein n=1 Tax=Ceratobasidium theobromae TaxID=1582974 RepID=A0A5N5QWC8_9AGAM|nr:hypothetical protein CTheo_562 [Ceratobasidium theobromae]
MRSNAFALFLAVTSSHVASAASQTYAATLASLYGMPTSTVLPFPSTTIPAPTAQAFITAGASPDNLGWSLSKGRLQNGGDNMAFVADPFPSASLTKDPDVSASSYAQPVLQITYPAGSYSNHTGGGAQFIQLWNTTSNLQSVVLSYEVAFDSGFDFVKGGKLPGLRGGPDVLGCSGGKQADGKSCFSTRLMWRTSGNGEIPVRLAFHLHRVAGNLTAPTDNVANGQLQLFYNDLLAISQNGVQYRNSDDIASVSGLFFSTFFGGEDSSWASPKEQHTYFRNIRMWGSDAPSNMTGNKINAATPVTAAAVSLWLPVLTGMISAFLGAAFAF